MDDYKISIVPLDGSVVIELHGVLAAGAAAELHETVRPMTGRYDADQMTFDCSGVRSVDSVGVEALVRIGRIPRGSGRLTLIDPAGVVSSAIDAEDVSLFDVVEDRSDLQSTAGG